MQNGSKKQFSLPTGEDLRQLRLEQGLSQAQLAEKAGVSQPLIARIEKGTINPPLLTVKRILDVLYESSEGAVTAQDIAIKPVIVVRSSDLISDAIEAMGRKGVSQAPVCDDNGTVVGGLTEKKLTEVLITSGRESMNAPVASIMEAKFPAVSKDATIQDIQDKLLEGPAVVVMDGTTLYGIVTKTDLLHYFRSSKA
ncbi:MAG TPA: CBS domain-containing protein [Candidatus Lokiarchaeia archaeon]|nr:CBS domain-containing protein [Candidatus Lokiarchaeia archaeon]